jgi:hypothetical protein
MIFSALPMVLAIEIGRLKDWNLKVLGRHEISTVGNIAAYDDTGRTK